MSKNYFDGIADELNRLQNRLCAQINLEKDIHGHFKMNMIRDSFMTIKCAMQSVNDVMNLDVEKDRI